MKRLIYIAGVLALTAPIRAEVGTKEMTLAGISDCVKDAMASSSVEDGGDAVILSCNAEKAKVLFNFLGNNKVPVEVVQDKNGKFENRQFGNNACYHRIEDASGKPASDFRCDLVLVTGTALAAK